MRVLTTSTETQSIKFIPRNELTNVVVELTNKDTKEVSVYNVESICENGYMTVMGSFALTEDTRYSMSVKSMLELTFTENVLEDNGSISELLCDDYGSTENIVYRDIILCTDQSDLENYNIQKDDYVFPETNDNEYVVTE